MWCDGLQKEEYYVNAKVSHRQQLTADSDDPPTKRKKEMIKSSAVLKSWRNVESTYTLMQYHIWAEFIAVCMSVLL